MKRFFLNIHLWGSCSILIFLLFSFKSYGDIFRDQDFFGDCGEPGIECLTEYTLKTQSPDLHFTIGKAYTIAQVERQIGSKAFLHVYSSHYEELMIIGMDPKDVGKIVILKETDT